MGSDKIRDVTVLEPVQGPEKKARKRAVKPLVVKVALSDRPVVREEQIKASRRGADVRRVLLTSSPKTQAERAKKYREANADRVREADRKRKAAQRK